jgi:predicted PP-loop superfamily ATPase
MQNQQTLQILPDDSNNSSREINVDFLVNNKSYKIFFRSYREPILTGNYEAFVATGLLPAMKVGTNQLIAKGEISAKFLSNLSTIQDIYCVWNPAFHRVDVENIKSVSKPAATEPRVGTFFSGGVDSFYTFLKRQSEITDLILVHGLDMQLQDRTLREKTSEKLREVAANFGKNLIEIETNIRELLNRYVDWRDFGHGATLAAIGHLLFPHFQRIFIPASHTYAELFPCGTHLVLDPLWSSESLEFVHDGCEATRVEKIALIAKYDIALQSLRVCWRNPNSSYNCGRCEKCLMTMVALKANNALSRCTTFEETLNIKHISKLISDNANTRPFIQENLQALRTNKTDLQLEKALQSLLNEPMFSRKMRRSWRTFTAKLQSKLAKLLLIAKRG